MLRSERHHSLFPVLQERVSVLSGVSDPGGSASLRAMFLAAHETSNTTISPVASAGIAVMKTSRDEVMARMTSPDSKAVVSAAL